MNQLTLRSAAACLLTLTLALGCGHEPAPATADGHDHDHGHDHPAPTSFAGALANVDAINHELSEAFVTGDNDEADIALHEAFDAVAALKKFAGSEAFDEAKTAEVTAASEALLTAYNFLHGVHAGKDVDFGEVSSDIDAAIARLAAVVPDHPVDHDHDGHDHDGSGHKEGDEDHDHDHEENHDHDGHDHDHDE